jgi:hypothetical protein
MLDAFETGLSDQAFDASYHNGLWIYFEDEAIRRLADEQARITRRYMVVTVHCGHHSELKAEFARRAVDDPLYAVRFFSREELLRLLKPIGPTTLYPFGGAWDRQSIEGWRLGRLPMALRRWIYRRICIRTSPSGWERVMAVTEIQ